MTDLGRVLVMSGCIAVAGCDGGTTPPLDDTGVREDAPGLDAVGPAADAPGSSDTGATVDALSVDDAFSIDDAFSSGSDDAFSPDDTGPSPDSAASCPAGVECGGYAAALAAAPRGSTSLDNCVVQLHQTDCCGAMAAYGVNHAARTTLCPAEASCVATYPAMPGCSDTQITTDSGEVTNDMSDVRLRLVDPTPCSFDPGIMCYRCETFVCTRGTCRSEPGIAGGCGP